MKKRYYLILALALIGMKSLGNQNTNPAENEVEIDLNSGQIQATQGLDINYGDATLKVFDATRDEKKEKFFINDDFVLSTDRFSGNFRIEAKSAELSTNSKDGVFGESFSWFEVGDVTGAEKPNDKIYFGGKKTIYKDDIIKVEDAWLTTDPKVNTNRDRKDLGYYLTLDSILIEPDKQITLKGADLYIQDFDVMPYKFPWFRFNIRNGSKVPLFPEWGTDEDYGWNISWGTLYESTDNKFRGGFAPKFGDTMGILVGRWENWYKFDKIGESKLNVTDFLVWKKDDDNIKDKAGREDESFNDRWDVEYTHKYEGEKGYFDFGFQSLTYNMNEALKDVLEDYDAERRFDYVDEKGNLVKKPLGQLPDMGGHSNFYTLNTSLKELGKNKDITLDAKVKLTSDKEIYKYIVSDEIDGMGFTSQIDNDLFSNVKLTQDNDKYSFSSYYNYLYDLDKGSNINDDRSRGEDFGFGFTDKERKVSLYFDEVNGDKFRKLNSWERNPDKKLSDEIIEGLNISYTPWTVAEYDEYNSQNYGASFGEYDFVGDTEIKLSFNHKYSEKKLNTQNDPFRREVFGDNRVSQYNRFEDTIYEEVEENKISSIIYHDWFDTTFFGGTYKETIETREGSYNDKSQIYLNESDFYGLGLAKNDISLGKFGTVDINGNVRRDEFSKGEQNLEGKLKETINDDTLTKYDGTISHKLEFGKENENILTVSGVGYSYDGEKSQEYGRVINKDNSLKVADEFKIKTGKLETSYKGEVEKREKAINDEKSLESLKNTLDFSYDDKKLASFYYNESDRYSFKTPYSFRNDNETYNDLSNKDFGVTFYAGNHEFYYKNQSIDNFARDIDLSYYVRENGKDILKPAYFNGLDEEIRENIYGYSYSFAKDKKLTLQYTEGKDKAWLDSREVIDIKNRLYTVAYQQGTEVQHMISTTYGDYQGNYVAKAYENIDATKMNTDYNSDIISLSYSFKDKRMSQEELKYYAGKEFGKNPGEVTPDDISRVREIFERNEERTTAFNLGKSIDNRINYFGDYKRSLNLNLSFERDKSDLAPSDYWDALKEFKASVFYSQKRIGLGYIFSEEANINSQGEREVTEREHEFSFHAKIGKPSEGWRTKMYIQFYDDVKGQRAEGVDAFIDEAGIEIGKEMGYYEWSVAYIRDYNLGTRDYEWKTALQFTLLTFPDNKIFSIGAKDDRGEDGKLKADGSIFSGIKVEDIE